MRIAMIGAGAMGAMFGARFARTGAEVVLYDIDADHIAAISANGLVVTDPDGEAISRLAATTSPVEVGPVDCAVIMVDANATEAVAVAIAPVLAPDAFILTLQNGIGNIEKLVAAFGKERVVAGCTYNSAARQEPGKVLHSNIGETTIGELDGSRSDRVAAIAGLFRECGLPIEVSDNVIGHIWMKFVLNAAINPVCAVTRLRPGEIIRVDPARRLLEGLLDEILAVVDAKGIQLPSPDARAEILDHAWERYNRPSMLQHVEGGRRTEIGALNGELLGEAAAVGIACPKNEAVVLTIRALEARAVLRAETPELDEAALEAEARATPRPA